jgi:L-iditol 2-dehydrogenase
MRIAELTAPRQFRLVESEVPKPGPGEVLVRVEAVGICGSDLHSYAEGGVGDTPCQFPQVLGHEPAGTVVSTGAGVAGWSSGDRAFFEPAIYCYHCEFCRAGLHNVCASIRFMSTPGDPGYFREFAAVPAHNLIPIPPRLSIPDATIAEPLAIALHSMTFADIRLGDTAVVFGAGPIGLLTVICLKLAGAGRVWAVDPVAHRRQMALDAGACAAIDPRAADPVAEILRDTGQRGVDVAIDCAAKDNTMNQSIHAVRNAGRVVITGIPSAIQVPLDFSPMRRKEVRLFNVRRSNHETETAVELLLAHPARFAALVTHTRPLEKIAEAFCISESYADGVGKMIVQP